MVVWGVCGATSRIYDDEALVMNWGASRPPSSQLELIDADFDLRGVLFDRLIEQTDGQKAVLQRC